MATFLELAIISILCIIDIESRRHGGNFIICNQSNCPYNNDNTEYAYIPVT